MLPVALPPITPFELARTAARVAPTGPQRPPMTPDSDKASDPRGDRAAED